VALVNSTVDILRKKGQETGQTEPGLVGFYNVWPGNVFFQHRLWLEAIVKHRHR